MVPMILGSVLVAGLTMVPVSWQGASEPETGTRRQRTRSIRARRLINTRGVLDSFPLLFPAGDDPTQRSPRIAANPIPSGTGTERPTNPKRCSTKPSLTSPTSVYAVKADVPEGMSATEYADWISSYGLAPRSA